MKGCFKGDQLCLILLLLIDFNKKGVISTEA